VQFIIPSALASETTSQKWSSKTGQADGMKHSKANNTKKKKIRCEAPNQHCVRVRSETDMGVVLFQELKVLAVYVICIYWI